MNKTEYLKLLNEALTEQDIDQSDIDDILLDYSDMYDDAKDKGLEVDEVYQLLGHPSQVINELRDTLALRKQIQYRRKLISLSPFIAVITFMIIGLTTGTYHPTWLIFLIIPMSGIIFSSKKESKKEYLSSSITVHRTNRLNKKIVALTPFIALIIYILIRDISAISDITWMIFLIIPISSLLFTKNKLKKLIYLASLTLSIGFYLFMGYAQNDFRIGLLGFVLPVIVALAYGDIIHINFTRNFELKGLDESRETLVLSTVIILSFISFILLGIFSGGWAFLWMIFLSIPVAAIYLFDTSKTLTPYTPFAAVIIFFTLGYFFDLFHISWLAFLLIPIVAILENK